MYINLKLVGGRLWIAQPSQWIGSLWVSRDSPVTRRQGMQRAPLFPAHLHADRFWITHPLERDFPHVGMAFCTLINRHNLLQAKQGICGSLGQSPLLQVMYRLKFHQQQLQSGHRPVIRNAKRVWSKDDLCYKLLVPRTLPVGKYEILLNQRIERKCVTVQNHQRGCLEAAASSSQMEIFP